LGEKSISGFFSSINPYIVDDVKRGMRVIYDERWSLLKHILDAASNIEDCSGFPAT